MDRLRAVGDEIVHAGFHFAVIESISVHEDISSAREQSIANSATGGEEMPRNEKVTMSDLAGSHTGETGLKSSSRRDVMKGLALTATAGWLGSPTLANASSPAESGYPQTSPVTGDPVRVSSSSPVTETEYGRIRGFVRNGINVFKAIPYGADTSGTNRFMPPQKPAPWTGVRSCLQHGYVCPQPPRRDRWRNGADEEAWLFMWDAGCPNEECLNLNVWTPALDNGKRPVMVWLHGGGYSGGSSTELPSYDGENLSRRGDVVVVTVDHRLNVFGYLNLAAFGDKYALSGNAGMLDIVAALEWVRDNISRFGGDPGKVTIFGQSGGGGKVTTLMAMPSAKGLFHRAIVQSGSSSTSANMATSHTLAEALMKQLNISAADIDKLQQIPFDELTAAAEKVTRMPISSTGVIDLRRGFGTQQWMPVVGNAALPAQPFDPAAPEMSASVPLMVGNTLNEFVIAFDKPNAFTMTREELETNVGKMFEGKAGDIVQTFSKAYPGANNFQLWSVIAVSPVRTMTLKQCRLKADQHAAAAYCYRFDWQTPVLDGRPMAFHCAEIAFAFDNTARCENMTGNGPEARALAAKVSDAWIAFARSGDPNHPGLPHWKPFDPATNGTMVFDNECAFGEHLDDECQKVIND